jgi:hypothetical protein
VLDCRRSNGILCVCVYIDLDWKLKFLKVLGQEEQHRIGFSVREVFGLKRSDSGLKKYLGFRG